MRDSVGVNQRLAPSTDDPPARLMSRRAFVRTITAAGLSSLPLTLPAGLLPRQVRSITFAAEGEYRDPEGRYTVPIPPNWTAEEHDAYLLLRAPDGDLNVGISVVAALDAGEGIIAAWRIVDSTFRPSSTEPDRVEVPSDSGIDQTVVLTYDLGQTSGRIAQGLGFRVAGQVYVLIFRGDLQTTVRRQSQINLIVSGFRILGGGNVSLAGQTPLALDGARLSTFQRFIRGALSAFGVPGAAVAVILGGTTVYANGFGVTATGSRTLVTADTLMMAGSITKSFTTMLMGQFVDIGRLRWDEPVVNILPDFKVADPALTRKVTVRNLVCACTGVPRRDAEIFFNANHLTAEDVIRSLAHFPFYTAIGEAYQYSNQMVAVAGYIAALASGSRLGDLYQGYITDVQRRVLDPVGMKRTTFDAAKVAAGGNYATPHGVTITGAYRPLPPASEAWVRPVAPATGIWSTANELARYVTTELRHGLAPGGQLVISESNLEETWTPQIAITSDTSYGLGWMIQQWHGLRIIYHGGNTNGFSAETAFVPEADFGIVVLTNAQEANPVTRAIRQRLLELVYDQPDASTRQLENDRRDLEASRAALQQQFGSPVPPGLGRSLAGNYFNKALGEVAISFVGDVLVADAGEFRVALQPLESSSPIGPKFVVADPPFVGRPVRFDTSGPSPRLIYGEKPEEYTFDLIPIDGTPTVTSVS